MEFNQSQFQGIGEDSQYNDVLEISAIQKPSIIDTYLDKQSPQENGYLKRDRFSSGKDFSDKNNSERKDSQNSVTTPQKKRNDNLEQPQNFPDLETSAIAADNNHMYEKEFEDGSFVGGNRMTGSDQKLAELSIFKPQLRSRFNNDPIKVSEFSDHSVNYL